MGSVVGHEKNRIAHDSPLDELRSRFGAIDSGGESYADSGGAPCEMHKGAPPTPPPGLEQLRAQVASIRSLDFGGRLPEDLARVLETYIAIAEERPDEVDAISKLLDEAVRNYHAV